MNKTVNQEKEEVLKNRGVFIEWVIEHYPSVVSEYLGFGEKKNEDDKQHN